jgi:hypothetical protein
MNVKHLREIRRKDRCCMSELRKRLGDILIDAGKISHSQLEHALQTPW